MTSNSHGRSGWRGYLIALSFCLFGSLAHATEVQRPECIGLVLGGGGARGAAHVGVLKVLERERIPICAIAGTSVGSIVGALYAVGYRPHEIEAIITGINWQDIFNDEPSRVDLPMRRKDEDYRYLLDVKLGFRGGRIQVPRGAIQGQKLLLLLRRLLLPAWRTNDFSQLPVPFACVGTDIGNGEGVVYGKGDLAAAVRASMSVPGAFAPIRLDNRLMVDGGIYNNVPVDVVRHMGADRIIVVDVSSPLAPEEALGSSFAIARQMLDMLMQQRTQAMLATLEPDDILIRPDLGRVGTASFDRALEAVESGETAAMALRERLAALQLPEDAYVDHIAARRQLSFDPPLIDFVEVATHRSRSAELVAEHVRQVPGRPLDLDQLEQDISLAFGRGTYERISWAPRSIDGTAGIQVLPIDKGWGPNYLGLGLQLSDDFRGNTSYSLALEATTTGINARGGEWRNRIEIGRVTGLRSEFYQPWGELGRWYVLPSIDYSAFDQTVRTSRTAITEYRIDRTESGISLGYNLSPRLRVEVGGVFGRDRADVLWASNHSMPDLDSDFAATFIDVTYDSLDSVSFPTRGTRVAFEAIGYDDHLGGDATGERTGFAIDHALQFAGRHHVLLGLRGSLSSGDEDLFQRLSLLGGFLNLSGFPDQTLAGTQSMLARLVYYRRFGDLSRLFSLPAYVGASIEAGNVWPERRAMSLASSIVSGSAFVGVDTPLGPLFVGYGHADSGDDAFYLSFEKLLRPFGRRR